MAANLLDPGTYRGRAVEAALGTTAKGTEQVAVRFDLIDFPGQSITWFGFFTEKTENVSLRALRTAGWRGSDLMDLSDLSDPECPEVYLVIEHDKYTDPQSGKTSVSARVRWVNSTQGMTLKNKLDVDQSRALAARMKEKIAAMDALAKQNGASAPAAKRRPADDQPPMDLLDQQASQQDGPGEDIPFAPFGNF